MKFHQIAIYVPNHEEYKKNFFYMFGKEMYTDRLLMDGTFCPEFKLCSDLLNVPLTLSFNHDIMEKVEIEYITSSSAEHWHAEKINKNPGVPFISHLGVYCDEHEFESHMNWIKSFGVEILQDSVSHHHSNKRKEDGNGPSSRHYRDVIFHTEKLIGFNIKLSTRVDNNASS